MISLGVLSIVPKKISHDANHLLEDVRVDGHSEEEVHRHGR